jgi:hypothetical protein
LILSAAAQDFKLFYTKNVTDVTQFRNLTELDKQLSWRQVTNGAIDGYDKEDLFHVNGAGRDWPTRLRTTEASTVSPL